MLQAGEKPTENKSAAVNKKAWNLNNNTNNQAKESNSAHVAEEIRGVW